MGKVKAQQLKYAIPSSFTICAMMAAYYAILHAASGVFTQAAYGVIVAMIFDSLDGRSARLTNTCTAFGASFDSLTDMMAYGVAPAIMMYCWGLFRLGKTGYLVCFIFCACAGLRLARFNVMAATSDKRFFHGLSSTMAGGFIVAFILACVQYGIYGNGVIYFASGLTIVTALLMVSNLKFYSFKEIKRSPRLVAVVLTIVLGLLVGLTVKYKGLCVFAVLGMYILINLLLQPLFNSRSLASAAD
jgi:CDP-diacylglycerol--serine O-phosphatidyltransferase